MKTVVISHSDRDSIIITIQSLLHGLLEVLYALDSEHSR